MKWGRKWGKEKDSLTHAIVPLKVAPASDLISFFSKSSVLQNRISK